MTFGKLQSSCHISLIMSDLLSINGRYCDIIIVVLPSACRASVTLNNMYSNSIIIIFLLSYIFGMTTLNKGITINYEVIIIHNLVLNSVMSVARHGRIL